MKFKLSQHAQKRMIERSIPDPNTLYLVVAKNTVRKKIIAQCKKNGYNKKYIYFRTDTENLFERVCFVCDQIGIGEYFVITAFRLIY